MPLYGERGLGRAIETLSSGAMSVRSIPPPADGAEVRATPLDDGDVIGRLGAAVRPWSDGKNGKVEAKIFAVDPPVRAATIGSWLVRSLALASTAGATRLECARAAADTVFGPLFAAACNGGAYSAGLGGAYGRLAAWTSLGALAGAPADADIDAIEPLASRCAFLTFRAAGPWFHDVAWDLGALALRPDGATVAVLAATDAE
jgi:GNAT superfamily N-acetyltransferase